MLKTIQILSIGLITTLLLTACGPSEKDVAKSKELGFESYKEMKELTARGYADKNSYLEAISRTPLYCFDAGSEEYKKRCLGKKVIWIVNIREHAYPGKDRADVFDLDAYGSRKTANSIDILSNGKENPSGSYVVEGTAGKLNTFYPDLESASYIQKLVGDRLDSTLADFKKIAQTKAQEATSLGFSSLAEMSELTAKGYKTKQDYFDAKKKAEEEEKREKYEAKLKEYQNNKTTIDWISNKVGGYKGSAKCKVVLDLIQLSMLEKGFGGNADYKPTREKYELVDVKALSEGVSQQDLDEAYSVTFKAFGNKQNPAYGLDCYKIVESAPK